MTSDKTYDKRVNEVFSAHYDALASKTDKLFAFLFVFQWLLGIIFALVISPLTWSGESSRTHIHVYAAIFLGGLVAIMPIFMIYRDPGATMNRMVVAVSQMLFSILFIHLCGGRIETHFHVFGSLAFLAFYRDWRPVLIATMVTALDHLLRGALWPESVYGVLSAAPWRAFEHAAWVVFEDIILFYSMSLALAELRSVSEGQVNLEDQSQALRKAHDEVAELNRSLEEKVLLRTKELQESKQMILNQQQSLIVTSKMSALGEMAGGVAHEINTPLAVIGLRVEQMEECLKEGDLEGIDFADGLDVIKQTADRIASIVSGLRFFAREGSRALPQKIKVSRLIDETLSFCRERFSHHGIQVEVVRDAHLDSLEVVCRSVDISQVILNLLNNARDAIESTEEKWVRIETLDRGEYAEVSVTDSGPGIRKEIQDKIMQPFFTTKEVGKGTGLGLSISQGIMEEHLGKIYLDTQSVHTKFTLLIPKGPKLKESYGTAA